MSLIPAPYQDMIQAAAEELGISASIVGAQIGIGTHWSFKGDPQTYVDSYVKNMKSLMSTEGGNIQLVLAAYSAGPGNTGAGQQYAQEIIQASGLVPSEYMTTDNNGISPFNSNLSNYLADNQPVLSMASLQSEYPLVAALIKSVPELEGKFEQAVSGQWSTDRFIASVQNSSWWSTHSDTARQVFALMKSDPATYQQNINNLFAQVQQMASQLGASLSQSQLHQFATAAIFGGYDQNQAVLNQKFSQFVRPTSGNHFGGQAGSDEDQIRQGMRDLGVFLPEGQLDTQIKQIVGGQSSVQSVLAQLRTQAQAMYPAYASQINTGMNVSDIASPYIGRAQQLLEAGPGSVNIQSPLVKQALQYTLNGKPTAMPMYDFENSVRKDPRWVQTDNAQDSFMSNAHRVLQDFGFSY